MRLDEQLLKRAIPDASILYSTFPGDFQFSIDSRTLNKGDIFVALKGSTYDGHDFIQDVLDKGAAGLFIDVDKQDLLKKINVSKLKNILVVVVSDVLNALYSLAKAWRSQFDYPVVAITGSIGKTSTKEIVKTVLDLHDEGKYLASHGNQNTQLGLALNILRMRSKHKAAVFEVGVARRCQMAQRSALLKPTIALITGIGHSHMEGLGSLADIAFEKRDIFKYFSESNIGIVNGDLSVLSQVAYMHPVVKFGSKTSNQVQIRKVHTGENSINFVLKLYKQKYSIALENTHLGTVYNVAAAAAVAYLLDIPIKTIIKGIQTPIVVPGRFEQRFLPAKKGFLINDCYNANPESMKSSLLAFQALSTNAQKILVLGDMLELGSNSPFWHRQLGRFLRKVPSLSHVILVGDLVKWTKKTLPIGLTSDLVASWKEAADLLQKRLAKHSVKNEAAVLVKGSRGIELDRLVENFSRSGIKEQHSG